MAEDAETISFMDINPVNPGHVLTIPRRHVVELWDLSSDEAAALARASHAIGRRIRDVLAPAGINQFVANGEAAGQTVFHAHIHAIPRWPGDGWTDPWTPTAGDPQAIATVAARLRESAHG